MPCCIIFCFTLLSFGVAHEIHKEPDIFEFTFPDLFLNSGIVIKRDKKIIIYALSRRLLDLCAPS